MESELSVESLLEKLSMLLDQLQMETAFLKSSKNLKEIIIDIRDSTIDISNKIGILRKYLDRLKENNNSFQEMLSLHQHLNEKILHMFNNVPHEMIMTETNNNKKVSVQSVSNVSSHMTIIDNDREEIVDFGNTPNNEESVIKDCKKTLFKEPDHPKISLLKEEEFGNLPKYMIGRQSLEMINSLIISINQVLKAKYSLLSAGKAVARKKGELDLYLYYKNQDIICKSSGCKYFFTADDYERYMKTKLDRLALKLIMALRHCKRIREYRLQKELYYIVLP
ncbi:hypothetical protein M0802_011418 [Mischocyttarus mexicanus]|nr:hypothetical protein M0802_011418 [Mischocyttarus mexicanus]